MNAKEREERRLEKISIRQTRKQRERVEQLEINNAQLREQLVAKDKEQQMKLQYTRRLEAQVSECQRREDQRQQTQREQEQYEREQDRRLKSARSEARRLENQRRDAKLQYWELQVQAQLRYEADIKEVERQEAIRQDMQNAQRLKDKRVEVLLSYTQRLEDENALLQLEKQEQLRENQRENARQTRLKNYRSRQDRVYIVTESKPKTESQERFIIGGLLALIVPIIMLPLAPLWFVAISPLAAISITCILNHVLSFSD
jgi:hypothetical protein